MTVIYREHTLIFQIATLTLLVGCSINTPAPVFDLSQNQNNNQPASYSSLSSQNQLQSYPAQTNQDQLFYTVKPGDTLFSIAWYHSIDHEELASINNLKNNLIYPGQNLSLSREKTEVFFNPESLLAALNSEILNRPSGQAQASIILADNSRKPKKAENKQPISRALTTNTQVQRNNDDKELKWIWPADGKILARFSAKSNANKGLDIDASKGQAVRATAPGKVVYEGNGLRGYGNLVIIKHSKNYLSAYAHNDKVHVTENEIVKSGQRIADVGSSGTQQNKLHFEIRYKGKPVDPLNYLPEKNFF